MTQMSAPPGMGMGMKPHRGTMLLVFGIIGLVCCVIFGILAWVMGNTDLKEMDAGRMDPSGRGLTQAGKVLGIVSVCLVVVSIIVNIILMVAFGITLIPLAGAGGGGTGP